MSHEITSEDGLALALTPAWHGLGTVLPQRPTLREAFDAARLGWRVLRRPLFADSAVEVPKGDGLAPLSHPENLVRVPDAVALQRADTGRVLATVSRDYEVFQNDELADLAGALTEAGAIARVESAGSLRAGRNVFALVPRGEFNAGALGDKVSEYVLLANRHDGTGSLSIIPTSVRVVCANTLALAGESGTSGIRIRHTSSMRDRLDAAKRALALADEDAARLRTTIQKLATVQLDDADREAFFLKVYTAAVGVIPERAATEAERKAQARAVDTVSRWVANLSSPRNTGTGTEGSLWHALNAATEWSDHGRRLRPGAGVTDREARAQSALFGTSAAFKRTALAVAIQAAS